MEYHQAHQNSKESPEFASRFELKVGADLSRFELKVGQKKNISCSSNCLGAKSDKRVAIADLAAVRHGNVSFEGLAESYHENLKYFTFSLKTFEFSSKIPPTQILNESETQTKSLVKISWH